MSVPELLLRAAEKSGTNRNPMIDFLLRNGERRLQESKSQTAWNWYEGDLKNNDRSPEGEMGVRERDWFVDSASESQRMGWSSLVSGICAEMKNVALAEAIIRADENITMVRGDEIITRRTLISESATLIRRRLFNTYRELLKDRSQPWDENEEFKKLIETTQLVTEKSRIRGESYAKD